MELPESDFLDLKMTMLEKGSPPSQHMLRLIDYMLTKSTWGDSVLIIGNIGLTGLSDRTALLAHFESLCASPKTKACIAVTLHPDITTPLYSHLSVVESNTEYREFLASLLFDGMNARRLQVSPATASTNKWVWENQAYTDFRHRDFGML
ncbi:hypothetical protein LMH87_001656 [Akanthomyces muscarius]|uniref:Uncharacterized protein n=1 Tax=Akanthomyces muscarius TaxID=2231603 RepID=A0A9W8Q643_AKAMU|nr:hypothetical protein LMH87_001656 [Akanthomyces muscarius]KAJ4147109.1 hypothetical protein LMH87_001656 [Akanthomyces muscarius]